jgi:integrase
VALIRAAISSAFSKAVKAKRLSSNPTPTLADLKLGHDESDSRAKRTALSRSAVAGVLQHLDPDTLLWTQIMAATGLRPGEATALRWGDIDFGQRAIRVARSAKRSGIRGQERLGSTKTKSSERDVPIGASLLAALHGARDRQEALLRDLTGIGEGVTPVRNLVEPDMCIFYADLATKETRRVPRPRESLRRLFKVAAVAAGLPPSTVPHALRHSAITAMLAGDGGSVPGISVVDAAKIAGHARPSMTSDVYAHAVQGNLARGADLADALIAPGPAANVSAIGDRTK